MGIFEDKIKDKAEEISKKENINYDLVLHAVKLWVLDSIDNGKNLDYYLKEVGE